MQSQVRPTLRHLYLISIVFCGMLWMSAYIYIYTYAHLFLIYVKLNSLHILHILYIYVFLFLSGVFLLFQSLNHFYVLFHDFICRIA